MNIKKIILLFCIIINSQISKAASALEAEDLVTGPALLISSNFLRYPEIYFLGLSKGYKVEPVEGIIASRNKFKEKVEKWEEVKGRRMCCRDLLDPYLVDKKGYIISYIKRLEELKGEDISEISEEKINFWKELLRTAYSWKRVSDIFGDVLSRRSRYDRLFAFQISLEYARVSTYTVELQDQLRRDNKINWKDDRLYYISTSFSRIETNLIRNILVSPRFLLPDEKKEDLYYSHTIGLVEEASERDETFLKKIGTIIVGRKSLEKRPAADLPKSTEDAIWKYAHEREGIGFSVFLHLFPCLEGDIVPLEYYGLTKKLIGDETYKSLITPIVSPAYEMLVEDDEARQDVTTGGAAAAASSASSTGPDAAAAASSADVVLSTAAEGVDPETVGLLRKRR